MPLLTIHRILYPFFPREYFIGYGKTSGRRRVARSWSDILRALERYNGVYNIFIGIYSLDQQVDKVVFDVDNAGNLEDARATACSLCRVADRERIPCIPVFSGSKGFHVYYLFKPRGFGEGEMANYVIKTVTRYFRDEIGDLGKNIDMAPTSLRAMIRLPGSLHVNTMLHVIPLKPGEICNMPVRKIVSMARQVRDIELDWLKHERRNITEYAREPEFKLRGSPDGTPVFEGEVSDVERFLLKLVRPCVVYYAHQPEADHFIRTVLSTELSWMGVSPRTQVGIFRHLGWSDFNPRVSMYHAEHIFEKVRKGQLYPPSCRTLRQHGYCLGEQCPFYPAHFYCWGFL